MWPTAETESADEIVGLGGPLSCPHKRMCGECKTGVEFQMDTNGLLKFGVAMMILLLETGAVAVEPSFDVEVPYGFVGPLSLQDSHLFAIDRMTMTRLFSTDGGRTWKEKGPLVDLKGRPVLGSGRQRAHLPSLIRLGSGAIALKFDLPSSADASKLDSWIIQSTDETATWSEPVRITRPQSRSNATWLTQTKSGRLVLPTEYWFQQPDDRGIGICTAFYSDDEGRSWKESKDTLWVWENGGAGQGACEVPTVVETADGRLLMFMRTWYQRIAQSYSKDGGQTWSPAKLNGLVSGNSEIFLAQIPQTKHLLCIWNQADTQEIRTGYYRARLTAAVSQDSGASWGNLRTIIQSPGQKQVGRISPAGEPEFLRTPIAVPAKGGMLAEEFHMNRAPRIHFIGQLAYVRYTHRRYKYVDGKRERTVNQTRLRAIPAKWFYETARP